MPFVTISSCTVKIKASCKVAIYPQDVDQIDFYNKSTKLLFKAAD